MSWTKEERNDILGLFSLPAVFLTLFPKELVRGDRTSLTKEENKLFNKLSIEVSPQSMREIADGIKRFSSENQKLFPDEVKNAKRPMTLIENINYKTSSNGIPSEICEKDLKTAMKQRKAYKNKVAWTKELRKDVLTFMNQIGDEQRALFAEDLQRGDRFFTWWEATLWGHFYDKVQYNFDQYENNPEGEKKYIAEMLDVIKKDIDSGYIALVMNTLYDFEER